MMGEQVKEPFVIVNKRTYTESDVRGMSALDVGYLMNSIVVAMSVTKEKIEALESAPARERDEDFERRLHNARHAKRMLQRSLHWISPIRREKNSVHKRCEDEMFREVAHEMLDQETFDRILLRAQARMEVGD